MATKKTHEILNRRGLMVVLSSPSGAGKTSVCKRIINDDKKVKLSISHTTRAPRDNEIDGIDYFFISSDEFNSKIANKSFLEHANVFGNYYGTSKTNVEEILYKDFDVLFDIDWQGAQQIINSNYPRIITIFIMPPSKETIEHRLLKRQKDSGDNIQTLRSRMSEYETEISHKNEYKYVITNKNLDECTNEIIEIIKKERA